MVIRRHWLTASRNEKKITMKQLAESIGISESFYCQIESGKRRPSVENAKKLASILGFDWTMFFEGGFVTQDTA